MTLTHSPTDATERSTPERIMDAAEALFADRGYDGVSTRAITELAGVRLNLLSYHFGTKEKLFQAVIDRRLDIIIASRKDALGALRNGEEPITVGRILEAFIKPYYELASRGDAGWLNYARLIALLSQSEQTFHMLDAYMQRTVRSFLDVLQEALPNASRESIRAGFYYAITLMMASFSGMHRVKGLVEGHLSGDTLARAYRPLIIYAEAGMLALAQADNAL